MSPKNNRPKYEQMDQITHIHERSDMYVGAATRQKERDEYIVKVAAKPENQADNPIITKVDEIKYSPALLRIFVEALSNAIDNVWRSSEASKPCTKIKVDVDPVTGRTSIWNDGLSIPIEPHETSGIMIPELIFGHLLTSSNYNDDEERMTSGRNGLGIKLTNVFSKEFTVKTYDPSSVSLFVKTWRNNMRESDPHKITHPKQKNGYTEVSWIPDFEKFKMVAYDKAILSVIYCQVLNAAMVTKIPVWLNGKKIHFKTLVDYAKCFEGTSQQFDAKQAISMKSKDTEVVLCSLGSDDSKDTVQDFEHVAFVNGVYNKDGGVHVDQWSEEIFRPIIGKLNKPSKPQITIKDVKKHFRMFCVTQIANPKFSSQSKTRFVGPVPTTLVETKHINAIMKWNCIDSIRDVIRSKELLTLKKTEKKTKVFKKIPGYDPANNAGTKKSSDCTLILCEGLSAKTYAVVGIDVGVGKHRGRDWFGIYPLRGKLLNVRNASMQSTASNKEITDMIQALGLRHGVDYQDDANYAQLNYGRLMIMTDADVDGTHIKGLILNFIHHLFPSLLKRSDPFITSMQTPIVKIFNPRSPITFYTEEDFHKYMQQNESNKSRVKYYKGLGTSSDQEVRETFGKKLIEFVSDQSSDISMNKAFNGKFANDRKQWLERYTPQEIPQYSCTDPLCSMPVAEFIDRDLIKFSLNDCERSLPHIIDGLKNSHRKILYAAFKKPLSDSPGGASVKVAQFSGYVAEHTNYHHGEQCLMGTIIGMAQDFPGSNNVPLLVRDGQFGCVDPETEVFLWNSEIKKAKDIKVGDKLIGDDGTPRVVSKTIKGTDTMYKIKNGKMDDYIVNSNHILTCYLSSHKSIYWKESNKTWKMLYYNDKKFSEKSISTIESSNSNHHNSSELTKEEAYDKMVEFSKNIQDNPIFDINLQEYLNLPKYIRDKIKGVINSNVINWEEQDIEIDPYILGLWLGDGMSDCHAFSSIDAEIIKSWAIWLDKIGCEILHVENYNNHESCSYYIRRRGSGSDSAQDSYPIGSHKHTSQNCKGCNTSNIKTGACDWVFDKKEDNFECNGYNVDGNHAKNLNPFKELMKKNNLYKNKHVPIEYIVNSEENRLKLLAGMIDTDGSVSKRGNSYNYRISQSIDRSHMIESLRIVAGSLGFRSKIYKNTSGNMLELSITGNIHKIPVKVQRKKINTIPNEIIKNTFIHNIEIEEISHGNFCGWHIDKNERFLLSDFTITHNTRLHGGKDAASPRYIFTKLQPYTRTLYPRDDDVLLTNVIDDGDVVEPQFYAPILPNILINGCTAGIGTGWSCFVPQYNPLDLVECVKIWLKKKTIFEESEDGLFSLLPELTPWYNGYTGTIKKINDQKFESYGIFEKTTQRQQTIVKVTELPIGLWTEKFKDYLEDLLEQKKIKAMKNYSKPDIVHFEITELPDFELNYDSLKLKTSINLTNMVLFTREGRLQRFEMIDDIIEYFCQVRYEYYEKRKINQLKVMKEQLEWLQNKHKFLEEIMNDTLVIHKRSEQEIVKDLVSKNYKSSDTKSPCFDYLLNMNIRSMSQDKINSLQKDINILNQNIKNLENTDESSMWINDLDKFTQQYQNRTKSKSK